MTEQRKGGVSAKTDELASTLLGMALDVLANGDNLGVLLALGDDNGVIASYALANDSTESLLAGAAGLVGRTVAAGGDEQAGLGQPLRYALAYEGAVDVGDGTYADAVLLEFGERGYHAYSAYALYHGKGAGDAFSWSEPAPAGEVASRLEQERRRA